MFLGNLSLSDDTTSCGHRSQVDTHINYLVYILAVNDTYLHQAGSLVSKYRSCWIVLDPSQSTMAKEVLFSEILLVDEWEETKYTPSDGGGVLENTRIKLIRARGYWISISITSDTVALLTRSGSGTSFFIGASRVVRLLASVSVHKPSFLASSPLGKYAIRSGFSRFELCYLK